MSKLKIDKRYEKDIKQSRKEALRIAIKQLKKYRFLDIKYV